MSMTMMGYGRFVAQPELKQTKDSCVCEFSLATEEYRKGPDGKRVKFTSFLDCVVWDKAAEIIAKYGKKGDLVFVSATPRQDKWKDKNTGQNRSRIVFRVTEFNFFGNKKVEDGGDQQGQPTDSDNVGNDGGEDIPF